MKAVTKVSGTNWLCVKMPDGTWLPVFKLTDQQVREYREVENDLSHIHKVRS